MLRVSYVLFVCRPLRARLTALCHGIILDRCSHPSSDDPSARVYFERTSIMLYATPAPSMIGRLRHSLDAGQARTCGPPQRIDCSFNCIQPSARQQWSSRYISPMARVLCLEPGQPLAGPAGGVAHAPVQRGQVTSVPGRARSSRQRARGDLARRASAPHRPDGGARARPRRGGDSQAGTALRCITLDRMLSWVQRA